MMSPTYRVLHVGGTVADARRVLDLLLASPGERYDVEWVRRAGDAVERLKHTDVDAVLLDRYLPDLSVITALEAVRQAAPIVPVLVVGADEPAGIAHQVIQAGARDYLLSSRLDSYWLSRAIRHAMQHRPADDAFIAETERVGVTLSVMGDGLISADESGCLTYLNRSAETMTGWSRAEAAGQPLNDVLHIINSATRERTWIARDGASPARAPSDLLASYVLLRRDGSECPIEHSAAPLHDGLKRTVGTQIVLRDLSAVRALALRMAHLASHDLLTDLPNRLLLADRLASALALAQRHQGRVAVLFLDIDRFKSINDTLGHLLGDELLRRVAQQVTMCVRTSDTVSRYGGDEFVVVLADLPHGEDAARCAQKIIGCLAHPLKIAGHELHITVSIGISLYPDDGDNAETLLTRADMALYHAKDAGRDGYQFFEPGLNTRAIRRQSIASGLRRALERGEFELFYQPKMNLQSGVVVGAEALVRWRHPQRGLLAPAEFITIAEDCGLIGQIGKWVIYEACRQAQAWADDGLRAIPVSVNLSAIEFRHEGLLDSIVSTLRATMLDPTRLEIELTESALMADVQLAHSVLHGLKSLGVRLAIDDFGTGWSSLSYLKRFPIDALKIDNSFVSEVVTDAKAALIVSAVIRLGQSLTHRVIAEGVETPEQLAFLQAEGCDEGQGYLFSRPVASQEIRHLLDSRSHFITS
jgi:diguanylate cyclase (GGDEF)-like protein/PAS domain S-box-containing protein